MNQDFLKYQAQTSPYPLGMEVSHAIGSYIYDTNNKKYLDFVAGVSACTLGHQNKRVNDAIKNQYLNRMELTSERHLKHSVAAVMERYNTKRSHQSLPQKMTPIAYEQYIQNITLTDRLKTQIYTVQKDDQYNDPNQLKFVFS